MKRIIVVSEEEITGKLMRVVEKVNNQDGSFTYAELNLLWDALDNEHIRLSDDS